MKMNEQHDELFDQVTIKNIQGEIYYLIKKYCRSYHITGSEYRLFLHNSHPIQFNKILIAEIERFHNSVLTYCKDFPYLISHLSYENSTEFVTTDRIVGMIDLQKTYLLRRNQPSNQVVCSTYTKNLFIPENVLLGAIMLGINALAIKFYEQKEEIDGFDENYHGKYLRDIITYTNFLLRDRFISKLTRYYFQNYDSFNQLVIEINNRIVAGKINSKYSMLIKFILVWKKFDKILHTSHNSLRKALLSQIEFRDTPTLYEWWIFYRILGIFEGMKFTRDPTKFSNGKYSVIYQFHKHIGWITEKEVSGPQEISRYPDILIKKKEKPIAIIDAKYKRYRKEPEKEGSDVYGPPSDIVNQLLIYLDYGDESEKCDLGFVLFADDQERKEVTISDKNDPKRKILFLNFNPNKTPEKVTKRLEELLNQY